MFEKIFQVLFLLIMTVGILGLPLFYYLNARKKKLLDEYSDANDPDNDNDDVEESVEHTEESVEGTEINE